MRRTIHLFFGLLVVTAGVALAEVPPRINAGMTLEVPDADFDRGQVFYVHPRADTQIAITSTASLQRVVLTTSRAVGFVIGTFDPEDSSQPILGGALRVPVATFKTGSPSADARWTGDGFLDRSAHPEILFELTGASDVERRPSDDDDVFSFRAKLTGKLTVLGNTREIEMPAEIRFLLTNFETFTRTAGDLVIVEGSFEVTPADFGWEPPPRTARLVASNLTVDVYFVGSTRSPERTSLPDVNLEARASRLRYLTLAGDLADAEAAATHGEAYLAEYQEDAELLDLLARLILEDSGLANRDLALAGRLVKRARELDAESESLAETLSLLAAARGD